MRAMDKAIFEVTQNPGERSRYSRVIHDLASKTVRVTEKVKEIAEKEGLFNYASSARSPRRKALESVSF
jgi:hypothetical protein